MLDADFIEIKVKGKEKCSWIRQDQVDDGTGNFETLTIKEKMNKMILDYRGNCF